MRHSGMLMNVFFPLRCYFSGYYGFIRWRRTVDLLELGSVKPPILENGSNPYKALQIHDYLQAVSKKAIDLFQNYYPECLDM
ncbi:hypothetical protein B9Z19DRAFT_1089102, partial [Tuber borchii]